MDTVDEEYISELHKAALRRYREGEHKRDVPLDGCWNEDGEAWYPRSHYTRSQARTAYANMTGAEWVEIHVLARYMRWAPDDIYSTQYDGDYWVMCDKDHPDAFAVWYCH
jgi:hypothetical protein